MLAGVMILAARFRKEVLLDIPGARAPCETLQCAGNPECNFNCGTEVWG